MLRLLMSLLLNIALVLLEQSVLIGVVDELIGWHQSVVMAEVLSQVHVLLNSGVHLLVRHLHIVGCLLFYEELVVCFWWIAVKFQFHHLLLVIAGRDLLGLGVESHGNLSIEQVWRAVGCGLNLHCLLNHLISVVLCQEFMKFVDRGNSLDGD